MTRSFQARALQVADTIPDSSRARLCAGPRPEQDSATSAMLRGWSPRCAVGASVPSGSRTCSAPAPPSGEAPRAR